MQQSMPINEIWGPIEMAMVCTGFSAIWRRPPILVATGIFLLNVSAFGAKAENNAKDGILDFSSGQISLGEYTAADPGEEKVLWLKNENGTPFTVNQGYCFLAGIRYPNDRSGAWVMPGVTRQWSLTVMGGRPSQDGENVDAMVRCIKF